VKVAGTVVSNDNSGRGCCSAGRSFKPSFLNTSVSLSIASGLANPYGSFEDVDETGTGLRIGRTAFRSSLLDSSAFSLASRLADGYDSPGDVGGTGTGLRSGLRATLNRLRSSSRANGLDSSAVYGGGGCSA
jgi:hypothetical protein